MPYDSNGNATITRNRAVTGQTVQAAQVNVPFDDVQSMLSQVLLRSGVAPMTGPLNMNGFKITGSPDATNPTDIVTLSQVQDLLSDPWALQPVGTIIAASPWGFVAPPKNLSYRYIVLSAGQSGSGGYNEGALSSESVSGVSPKITAFATVTLAGSPLNGLVVSLINTEGRFLRGGGAGVFQESENLSHSHPVIDPGHAHSLTGDNFLIGAYNGTNQDLGPGPNGSRRLIGISSSTTGISLQSSGGAESRPRNMSVIYYMRIL